LLPILLHSPVPLSLLRLDIFLSTLFLYAFSLFYVIHTVHILVIITSTNLCTAWNTFMSYNKTPTCFGTEMPSSGSSSVQRSIGPICQSSYCVALTEVIKILNIRVPKYIPHHPTWYTAYAPLGQDLYIPTIDTDVCMHDSYSCK
jgi:hypothetical protein